MLGPRQLMGVIKIIDFKKTTDRVCLLSYNCLEKKVVDSRSPLEATPPKFGT